MRSSLVPLIMLLGGCTTLLDLPDPDLEEGGSRPDVEIGPRRSDLVAAWNHDGWTSLAFYDSQEDATFAPRQTWRSNDGGWSPRAIWLAGTFDRDLLDDVVEIRDDDGMSTLTVRASTGTGFVAARTWAERRGTWSAETTWLAGDFDGDRLTDVAAVRTEPEGLSIAIYRSFGFGFEEPEVWPVLNGRAHAGARWGVGRFDRDDRADLVVAWDDGGKASVDVLLSADTSFEAQPWATTTLPWADSTRWLPGDFDADGLDDLAAVWKDGEGDQALVSFSVLPSKGSGFGALEPWTTREGGWGDRVLWMTGDFDADGDTDLADVWEDGGRNTLTLRRSQLRGARTFGHEHWAHQESPWTPSAVWLAGVFDPE